MLKTTTDKSLEYSTDTNENESGDSYTNINEQDRKCGNEDLISTQNEMKEHLQSEVQKEVQKEVLTRLKKIEGQVRGVQKMIQEGRTCGDIVTQLTAVKAAVNRVGFTMLACHLADQVEKDILEGKDVKSSLNHFMNSFKKFS